MYVWDFFRFIVEELWQVINDMSFFQPQCSWFPFLVGLMMIWMIKA
jgi:hypothetical protein